MCSAFLMLAENASLLCLPVVTNTAQIVFVLIGLAVAMAVLVTPWEFPFGANSVSSRAYQQGREREWSGIP